MVQTSHGLTFDSKRSGAFYIWLLYKHILSAVKTLWFKPGHPQLWLLLYLWTQWRLVGTPIPASLDVFSINTKEVFPQQTQQVGVSLIREIFVLLMEMPDLESTDREFESWLEANGQKSDVRSRLHEGCFKFFFKFSIWTIRQVSLTPSEAFCPCCHDCLSAFIHGLGVCS